MKRNQPPTSPSSLGELRAQWREQHLCLRCAHHAVCKMASALDPHFLVVISHCLAFEPPTQEPTGERGG